ncbi:heterokaryon incompatibility protein [Rutstroemia sp. NJR-2017a BVV2]|nr:heterokaryon incompatibility protein [Rutstroemia sp. NJR-2017a BVV2]
MSEPYQYTPLDASSNAIRLLTIHPIDPHDPSSLNCSLVQMSLDHHPAYHALSYAWLDDYSSDLSPQEITVDGKQLILGPNLTAALKARREREFGHVPIWIDAICINQADIHERSDQILRMRQIYAQAVLVTVWLGPERDDSHIAFQMIRTISRQEENSKEWLKDSLMTRKHSLEWRALYHMLRRPWWRRIWIIQEIVAAKDVVLFCGSLSLDPRNISRCLNVLSTHQRIQQPLLLKQEGLILDYGTFSLASAYLYRESWKYDSLLCTLYRTGLALASDPRDKVYAILNLASDAAKVVSRPDYRLSIAETYKQAVVNIIRTSNRLDILSLAGFTVYPRILDIELPSWIPDFSHRATSTMNSSISSLTPVSADGNSAATVSFNDETGTMNVRGFIVDSVDGLAQILESTADSTPEKTFHQSSSRSITYNGREAIDAICQSLIAGSLPPMRTPTTEILQDVTSHFLQQCHQCTVTDNSASNSKIFAAWYHRNQNLIVSGKSIKQWAHEVFPPRNDLSTSRIYTGDFFDYRSSVHWNLRRMITTAAGYVGLGGNVCKTGDVICVIHGCSTPIILRGKGNAFQLVGEAYIHGIMNGEALKGISSGKYTIQDLELL